jgi:hypothetical protein
MTRKELQIVVDTYVELLRAHQLNIELLETLELTLESIKDYCIKHSIPFGNHTIRNLLSKVNVLLNEVDNKPNFLSNRRFFTDPKTDDNFTEPKNKKFITFRG